MGFAKSPVTPPTTNSVSNTDIAEPSITASGKFGRVVHTFDFPKDSTDPSNFPAAFLPPITHIYPR